eukprot:scaffold194467_cov27-Tisochrysis_lutea.AAC.4
MPGRAERTLRHPRTRAARGAAPSSLGGGILLTSKDAFLPPGSWLWLWLVHYSLFLLAEKMDGRRSETTDSRLATLSQAIRQ